MPTFDFRREEIEESFEFAILGTSKKFENLTEQRRAVSNKQIIGYRVTLSNMTYDRMKAFRDFYASVKGSLIPFSFISPFDGTTYSVRFEPKSYSVTYSAGKFSGKCELTVLNA